MQLATNREMEENIAPRHINIAFPQSVAEISLLIEKPQQKWALGLSRKFQGRS